MTTSDLIAAFDAIRLERDNSLRDLGPQPAWYRPFARVRWRDERANIMAMALIMTELLAGRSVRVGPAKTGARP